MNWSKAISEWEILFICIFLLIYAYYFVRVYRIGKQLGKPSRAIFVKFLLRSTYFGLMIVALLGPSFGITETEARSTGKDIYLAVDLSASMNTTDVSPSRLGKSKLEISNLISQLGANRLGVIVFSTQAYWQIPLTFDLNVANEFISNLATKMVSNKGSNINAPLELIANKLKETDEKTRGKVVIILTDGESFAEVKPEVKNDLRNSAATIMFLAVGTETGGFVNENGTPISLEDGSMAISKLDLPGLTKLAKELNAKLFILNNQENETSGVLNQINKVENKVVDHRPLLVANNKYSNFLLLALILIAIDVIFTTKIFEL